ncbi:hypothetical protein [Caulobacter sp. 17J65-9]|uniref:hypothetical protein n=1 Tax=Caulobacter sp. 17J65-9 TaxID=2709382 RepID=UPI0013C6DE4E|nr:hypothetical protein [Caulobacter sp. 17J65-9]NEX91598.1 hypothetical protein [Caulobacter sp. 17J65-9]
MVAAELFAEGPAGRFDMARVVRRTFGVIRRNLIPFCGLAVVFGALPYLVVTLGGQQVRTEAASFTNVMVSIVGWVVTTVCSYTLQAAIIYCTVKDLNGKKPSLEAALQVGLRNFLALFGLAIVMGLGLGLAFVLLIVPGCMLMAAWAVAVPAVVMENKGVGESLSRSSRLTKGSRWPVFGLIAVYSIVVIGLSMGLAAGGVVSGQTAGVTVVQALVMAAITVVTSVVGSAGGAAIYCELRAVKEGVGVEALASVFD